MLYQLPQLGLVCITASNEVRFRTVTRRTLSKLSVGEQTEKLREIYLANIKRLRAAIAFCSRHQFKLYRLSSNLFPFADEPIGETILTEFESDLAQIGSQAQQQQTRLVLHPNQYVVLNSDRPQVIQNSVKVLTTYARILDLLGLPRSPWALMNIHGGKGDRMERLVENILKLPEGVRSRLTIENDEHTYNSNQIAEICHDVQIPMVFDAHHHLVCEQLDSYNHSSIENALELARTTWQHPEWQLVHISNGRDRLHDTKHSDFIDCMPESFRTVPWIEVEAKKKEEAIFRLRRDWLNSISPIEMLA